MLPSNFRDKALRGWNLSWGAIQLHLGARSASDYNNLVIAVI